MEKEYRFDPFKKIGKEWGLVCAGNDSGANLMTVSWGGVGVLWGKNVVFIFIRSSRYTKKFIDEGETFSLSFMGEGYREELNLCGSKSGRDVDKWKETGLTPEFKNGTVYPKQAETVYLCRKLAAVPVGKETFIDPCIEGKWYADGDMHTMYVGEITEVIR